MKRIELFEFEDFQWLPNLIRTSITNLIIVFHKLMGTSEVIANLVSEVRRKHDFSQITDLGSGSGGPMLEVISKVNGDAPHSPINLMLTDLHPNPGLVADINQRKLANVSYHPSPVDATNLSEAPTGLKTMVASFHHMNPSNAKKILQSAQKSKEPILIYEVGKNTIPVLAWWLFLPISLVILIVMSVCMTPFVKGLSLPQLVFTYLIPIIPLVYAWDGQASIMRTYTFEDIEALLAEEKVEDYGWEMGDAKKANGKNLGYYVMGYPTR